MSISIEQIDLLRKRADVGYKEAKEALEKCNGDVVEALSYLEEQNKIKPEKECPGASNFVGKIKKLIIKANKIKFVILRDEKVILNIPSTLAAIFVVIALPVVIISIMIALVSGCKIRFHRENGENLNINSKIDKVTNLVTNVKDKITKEINNA